MIFVYSETVDSYHANAMNMQNVSISNRISEETNYQSGPSIGQPPQQPYQRTQSSQPANVIEQRSASTNNNTTKHEIPENDLRHANEIVRESEGKFTVRMEFCLLNFVVPSIEYIFKN